MLFNEEETLKILGNKFVYLVPSVSVFGDFYNLSNLSVDVLENFRNDDLFPAVGVTQKVNNLIARKSAEFFTKMIKDEIFYVSDLTSYDAMLLLIDDTIETLEETDNFIFEEIIKTNNIVPLAYFDSEFEYAVNDDPSGITVNEIEVISD